MLATRSFTLILLVGLAAGLASATDGPPPAPAPATRLRQPVALAGSPDGSRLFAANRRSGSLSVIETATGQVVAEHDLGRGLADLATMPDGHLLVVDRVGDSLLVLKPDAGSVAVEARLAVPPDPVAVLLAPDGASCVVASTGSRSVAVIALARDSEGRSVPKLTRTIALPFPPRLLAWLVAGSKLVAADAFGGGMAVIDPSRDTPLSIRSLPAHNIRGLTASPDGQSLMVTHQTLSRLARSNFEDVHWGNLLKNHLRILKVDALLAPEADILRGSRLFEVGRTNRAAGDPGAIAFDRDGRMVIALTGVHEVALVADTKTYYMQRVAVGQNPSAVLPSLDGKRVYVADAMDDTISVVDVATGKKIRTIELGPRPALGPVERGERLFHDASLSHDRWMSCQSCHTDGQSNGLVADTLGDGGYGAPKRVTSLLGVGSTGPWTWLGTIDRLEDQVRKSIETSMRGPTPSASRVDDLTAYLRSLPAPRSFASPDVARVEKGREVFRARKCAACHAPPEYTAGETFDVGLIDEAGNARFNPPSLRGVGDRSSWLHDGRATTLPDVFLQHRHPRESTWSAPEVDDLVAWLKTL